MCEKDGIEDMSELKPCPFCGGEAELIIFPGYFKSGLSSTGWLVKCKSGHCNQLPYISDHDAEEAWDRRVSAQPEPKRNTTPEQPASDRLVKTCTDAISRQVAIDAVHKNYDTILDFKSDGRTVADSFEDIIKTLPSVQPEPKWIPCAERLPERGVSVLISHVGYVYEDYLDIDDCDGELYFWNSGLFLYDERQNIAWMPLPSAWKGDNNG